MANRTSKAAIVGASMLSMVAVQGSAADITLQSTDGAFSLKGELVDFDGSVYILKSVFGQVSVNLAEVVCIGDECPDLSQYQKEFAIVGSDSVGGTLLPALLEAYSAKAGYKMVSTGTTVEMVDGAGESAAIITVASAGSGEGFAQLADGSATLGMSARAATNAEIASVRDAGLGDISSGERQTILALDSLVILVAKGNPVQALSVAQIGEIFSGKISNWRDVGGPNAAINVYRQNVAAGDTELFRSEVLALTGGDFTSTAAIISGNGDISQMVNADPLGIGFSSFFSRGDAQAVSVIGSCGIISAPSEFSIKTEEYPFANRLTMYSPDKTLPRVASELLEYFGTEAAQMDAANAGFVNLSVATESVQNQGLRFANSILATDNEIGLPELRNMTEQLINAQRLSSTFRFSAGSSTLDVRAEGDIARLLNLFANQDFTNKEILLVGFTDSVGTAKVNAELAGQRADQVLDLLRSKAPTGSLDNLTFTTLGFGEVSPMSCNDTPHGRFVNRRVEVWVRDAS